MSGKGFGEGGEGGVRPARVRLSAIGEAWGDFKAQWGTWVLAGMIVIAGNAALESAVTAVLGKPLPLEGGFRIGVPPAPDVVDAVLSAVLNGFFLGGMVRMACRQVRGHRISVSDLFGITDVLAQLAIGSAVLGVACCLLVALFVIPAFILAGVWMFTLPLIVDGRQPAFTAIHLSWQSLKGSWFAATVFHVVVSVLSGAGVCCFCFGIVFTMPLYSLSIAVLYRDAFPSIPTGLGKKAVPTDPDFA